MDNLNFTFKEICEKTGYASSTIRYYEKEFKLNIPRDANGRRVFTKNEFDKLLFIKELQSQNYSNSQIKQLLSEKKPSILTSMDEVAVTSTASDETSGKTLAISMGQSNESVLGFIDRKFNELNSSIEQLNENINSKERDVLLTENAKLKMELKRKAYEIIELKENLRYVKNKKKGFFGRLFS